MKTGVMLFASDQENQGPAGVMSSNSMLESLRVSRLILVPGAKVSEVLSGDCSLSAFSGSAIITWKKPQEDSVRIKMVDGELLLLPKGTSIEIDVIGEDQFIFIKSEVRQ